MIAYRLQTRDGSWQWLQTSSRLVYKNSKPDFIICTHRPLMYVSSLHTHAHVNASKTVFFSFSFIEIIIWVSEYLFCGDLRGDGDDTGVVAS